MMHCGWDIGGVHLKAARLDPAGRPSRLAWRLEPYEIWKDPGGLASRIGALRGDLEPAGGDCSATGLRHAITMTAELSDVFPSRAAGVRSVLSACRRALGEGVRVLDSGGRLLSLADALESPGSVASANWMASASVAARALADDGLFVDVGSTTTDLVPITAGRAAPRGRSDLERLQSGELVYTGVLRTPPAALADRVPAADVWCRPTPEHFTIMGDVWVLLGRMGEADYTVPTPDGRGRSPAECAARLARLVCAEPGDLGPEAIRCLAGFLAERQIEVIAAAIRALAASLPAARRAVVAGSGSFLATEAAGRVGLEPIGLTDLIPGLGERWDIVAPAVALALLAAEEA